MKRVFPVRDELGNEIGHVEDVRPAGRWRDIGDERTGNGSTLTQPIERRVIGEEIDGSRALGPVRGTEHSTRPLATLSTSQQEIDEIDSRTPRDTDTVGAVVAWDQ